jgi:hypothetical protein
MAISGLGSSYAYMGIQSGMRGLEESSQKIANPDYIDKSEPLIQTQLDANQIQSSAKVLKAEDDRIGTLLDIKA